MKVLHQVGTFEAAFGRTGEIQLVEDECQLCGNTKTCLYSDGSEGEYGGVSICQVCINEIFKEGAREKI